MSYHQSSQTTATRKGLSLDAAPTRVTGVRPWSNSLAPSMWMLVWSTYCWLVKSSRQKATTEVSLSALCFRSTLAVTAHDPAGR